MNENNRTSSTTYLEDLPVVVKEDEEFELQSSPVEEKTRLSFGEGSQTDNPYRLVRLSFPPMTQEGAEPGCLVTISPGSSWWRERKIHITARISGC
jgi:hypothetical protein